MNTAVTVAIEMYLFLLRYIHVMDLFNVEEEHEGEKQSEHTLMAK